MADRTSHYIAVISALVVLYVIAIGPLGGIIAAAFSEGARP